MGNPVDGDVRLETVSSRQGQGGVSRLKDQEREEGFLKVKNAYERGAQRLFGCWTLELGGF